MSTIIVIFGASGDLAARKLLPALYANFRKGRLDPDIRVVGFSRSPFTDDSFRTKVEEAVRNSPQADAEPAVWQAFASRLHYQSGAIDARADIHELNERLHSFGDSHANWLFYLATAPELYRPAVVRLSEEGMLTEHTRRGYRRIVVEKPFGADLPSALALNEELHDVLRESQIYRIDHYLGKETVQNMLVFRFGNAIFEPLWNRNYIDHVQITVAESVGVEHRAGYYERSGVLRDMFQNHLLQILTLVAMEPPVQYEANALRNEKVKVLSALREIAPEHSAHFTVRGQYEGYRTEPGVAPTSETETFAALRIYVDNWRWQGVPFYLRSGKRMRMKTSEIVVQFRRPPTQILDVAAGRTELFTNRLSIMIQPDEGIHLRFLAKVPDQGLTTRPVDMEFRFRDSFSGERLPEAYERLLLDAMNGDASLFTRSDEIELSWRFVDSVRAGWWGDHAPPLLSYAGGTWGPASANDLLGQDGRWWENGEGAGA